MREKMKVINIIKNAFNFNNFTKNSGKYKRNKEP